MSRITTKDTFGVSTTYEVVEKVPDSFIVWNIGENMGTDEYIPFAARLSQNKDDANYFKINTDSIRVVKLNVEDVMILRDAGHYGIENLFAAKKEVSSKKARKSASAIKKHELAVKALPIFKNITA